jgi:hypothetical protein
MERIMMDLSRRRFMQALCASGAAHALCRRVPDHAG